MKITIAWLYPKLMNIYGDYGNVLTLQRRLEWRNIETEILEIDFTNSQEITKADILLMGGGQDRQQTLCAKDFLENKKEILEEACAKNVPGLFVCGAYQLMAAFYHSLQENEFQNFDPHDYQKQISSYKFVPGQGADIPGLAIFPQYTLHFGNRKPRCIGNVVSQSSLSFPYETSSKIVGFENHGGRTYDFKENTIPLGKIIKGNGNNGEDRKEGIVYHNFLGSYLHGLLMKNPHLADFLIFEALKNKYRIEKLEELDDDLEWQTHDFLSQ